MNANDIMLLVVKVVLAVVAALVTRYVIPALKSYVEKHRNDEIFGLIETAVRAAEQTITGSDKGTIKKEQVTELVTKWLKEKGIEISAEQLDQMIEECVYLMKNSRPTF